MVAEVCRVMKPGGVYICISHGLPSTRMAYLQAKGIPWDVEVKEIGESKHGNGVSVFAAAVVIVTCGFDDHGASAQTLATPFKPIQQSRC